MSAKHLLVLRRRSDSILSCPSLEYNVEDRARAIANKAAATVQPGQLSLQGQMQPALNPPKTELYRKLYFKSG